MRTDLSVLEVARLVGVSRARVYQRVAALPHSRPIAHREIETRLVRGGKTTRIPLAEALTWRNERLASGDPVGPIPDWMAVQITEPVAPLDVVHESTSQPLEPAPLPVGLPVFRPF